MKRIILLSGLVSICFLNNNYGMEQERTKEQIAQDLSKAQELVKQAGNIHGDVWYTSCMGHFETEKDLNLYKSNGKNKVLNLVGQAKPLVEAIVTNKTIDNQTRREAGDILEKINKLVNPDNQ